MSKMRMDGKPPLPRSPIRLRSRHVMRSNSSTLKSVQTPPGSLTKSEKLTGTWDIQEMELRPEYRSISCEFQSLAKMVQDELRDAKPSIAGLTCLGSASVFERGRFYDEYSARRNERLKRKKGEELGETKKTAYDLGVTVESSKRRDSKKLDCLRKSMAVAYSAERNSQTPRYMLRSSTKENKKPPVPVTSSSVKSAFGSERKLGTRRTRKI
ncbi:uncharacterized protein LOC116213582 [Punica granatum]|uniref:Uncharacterized protein n=2 Tax=Punica granatum TaxID=22663 RepID=A0A218WCK5_PUNGR|nr:uncharacterized protein LOC116213582 [Punica granatum]OWM70584.1 hypothetical protein CDL15_Pgr014257 [Punica granatum]PKI55120.1 hypothetical protein CRG98_024411 [Punica granatum]